MPHITRRIHVGAPPEVVRRQITDDDARRRWLDDTEVAPITGPDGEITWRTDHGGVRITLAPDGDGTEVEVTEEVALPALAPETTDAPTGDAANGDAPTGQAPTGQAAIGQVPVARTSSSSPLVCAA